MDIQHLSLEELLQLKARVANEITSRRAAEEQTVLNSIREQAAKLGLSVEDLLGKLQGSKKVKGSVAMKYRDPASGSEWSGRGRKPLWAQAWIDSGRSLNEVLI